MLIAVTKTLKKNYKDWGRVFSVCQVNEYEF
jgi:hypothetical protein